MCVSMSTQQIAIFGDKLVVQRETLGWSDEFSLRHARLNVSQYETTVSCHVDLFFAYLISSFEN